MVPAPRHGPRDASQAVTARHGAVQGRACGHETRHRASGHAMACHIIWEKKSEHHVTAGRAPGLAAHHQLICLLGISLKTVNDCCYYGKKHSVYAGQCSTVCYSTNVGWVMGWQIPKYLCQLVIDRRIKVVARSVPSHPFCEGRPAYLGYSYRIECYNRQVHIYVLCTYIRPSNYK